MSEELTKRVDRLDNAVFGDRDDPTEKPGLIVEQTHTAMALARTNEILTELRNAVLWIIRLLVGGFATALMALVYKGLN